MFSQNLCTWSWILWFHSSKRWRWLNQATDYNYYTVCTVYNAHNTCNFLYYHGFNQLYHEYVQNKILDQQTPFLKWITNIHKCNLGLIECITNNNYNLWLFFNRRASRYYFSPVILTPEKAGMLKFIEVSCISDGVIWCQCFLFSLCIKPKV